MPPVKRFLINNSEHITFLRLVLMFKGMLSFILEILYLFIIRFLQHISREVIPSCVDLHFSIYWISHELENRRRATQQMYENNFKLLIVKTKSLISFTFNIIIGDANDSIVSPWDGIVNEISLIEFISTPGLYLNKNL